MPPRAVRARTMQRRAAADRALRPLPCRDYRRPAKNVLGSRVELLLLDGGCRDALTGLNKLIVLRVSTKSEADRGAGFAIVKPKCPKHMARAPGTARASTAER